MLCVVVCEVFAVCVCVYVSSTWALSLCTFSLPGAGFHLVQSFYDIQLQPGVK